MSARTCVKADAAARDRGRMMEQLPRNLRQSIQIVRALGLPCEPSLQQPSIRHERMHSGGRAEQMLLPIYVRPRMASHDMTPRHQNCAQVPFALLRLAATPPAAIAFASTRCFLVACWREARDLACVSEKHILLLVEASEAADDHTPVREAYS
eukprot:CAMPEP_0183360446 /NCGR_PEP_ID=MMETSP0164_2-20130417/55213_1 /TAXON_ID=221442 /ORGANISM="Coccolithus pelagicus ssp braarudi, Strain PLY182g" /LENGTH=152 /DNA_ID=CAMNT_0025534809 /DNA_START=393 /DNA_END=851 /DNA_ORIENTATION=-